jgi:hypothetical protein
MAVIAVETCENLMNKVSHNIVMHLLVIYVLCV